jgi:hypothetical protein
VKFRYLGGTKAPVVSDNFPTQLDHPVDDDGQTQERDRRCNVHGGTQDFRQSVSAEMHALQTFGPYRE